MREQKPKTIRELYGDDGKGRCSICGAKEKPCSHGWTIERIFEKRKELLK
jgi:hypothetical protein